MRRESERRGVAATLPRWYPSHVSRSHPWTTPNHHKYRTPSPTRSAERIDNKMPQTRGRVRRTTKGLAWLGEVDVFTEYRRSKLRTAGERVPQGWLSASVACPRFPGTTYAPLRFLGHDSASTARWYFHPQVVRVCVVERCAPRPAIAPVSFSKHSPEYHRMLPYAKRHQSEPYQLSVTAILGRTMAIDPI